MGANSVPSAVVSASSACVSAESSTFCQSAGTVRAESSTSRLTWQSSVAVDTMCSCHSPFAIGLRSRAVWLGHTKPEAS